MRTWTVRAAEPVHRWTVGAVIITRVGEMVLEGGLDAPSPDEGFLGQASRDVLLAMDWLRPDFITEDGAIKLAMQALVIQTPGRLIVVDTCVGNDKDRPQHFWQQLGLPFLDNLAAAGIDRERVDTVVCTHLHVDHVGWNTMKVDGGWQPTFPNARYLFGRVEYEHCCDRIEEGFDGNTLHPAVFMADSVRPVFDAGLVDLVEVDYRVCAEVRLIPTHGHTPGHVSVVIESEGARALITGDTIHHPCQIANPDWAVRADNDQPAAIVTRQRLLDSEAGSDTLFIGTHWGGRASGRVIRSDASYRLDRY